MNLPVMDHNVIPVQTPGPGDDLGGFWLFPPDSMPLSARALGPANTILFCGTRLREQCEQDHELGYQIMQRIAHVATECLRATQRRLTELAGTKNLQKLPAMCASLYLLLLGCLLLILICVDLVRWSFSMFQLALLSIRRRDPSQSGIEARRCCEKNRHLMTEGLRLRELLLCQQFRVGKFI